MGKQSHAKKVRRQQRLRAALHPMAFLAKYETARSVFGLRMEPKELCERVGSYSWKESLIQLAHLAAVVANDGDGPNSDKARTWLLNGLRAMTGSSQDLIRRAIARIEVAGKDMVVAHEEAISLIQHLILLYGQEEGDGPAASEVALWLLGAGDHLDEWARPDTRVLTEEEQLIAVQARVSRFNRSMDSYRGIVRTFEILRTRPRTGPLSDPAIWAALQRDAFGEDFETFFQTKALPLFMLSHGWGDDRRTNSLPFLPVAPSGNDGPLDAMTTWLKAEARTREDLRSSIRVRMREGALLPHAPTALLHAPLILLDDEKCLAVSPWMVRVQLQTGIWARYLRAAKKHLGDGKGAMEWTRAFGLMFESWLRDVATMVTIPASSATILLPTFPGAADEIEDVVLVEPKAAVLFSGKSKLVNEVVARHADSRSALLDWYESFFFGRSTKDFSAGSLRLLSANIDRIRGGNHEPRLARGIRIYPVLVTFDQLGEDTFLYEWITKRCKDLDLLQQDEVGPITIAHIEEFEKLLMYAGTGESVVRLLRQREHRWANRRLDVQLFGQGLELKPPARMEEKFDAILNDMSMRLWGRKMSG